MSDGLISIRERSLFLNDLAQQVNRCRQERSLLGVAVINLPDLRNITMMLGYEQGDLLLSQFAQRLKNILRPNDTLTRLCGNEFVLVLSSLKNPGHAELAANKVLSVVEEPFKIAGQSVKLRIILGLALFPDQANGPEKLLQRADIALSRAAELNTRFLVYSEATVEASTPSFVIEAELEEALRNNDLFLNYQPKIDLKSRSVCAVEVLSRWQSPEKGPVPPDVFIPVAEKAGLILPFTLWVLNGAMRQCRECRHEDKDLSIAVNISANILHDSSLLDLVTRTMKLWGTEPAHLILEVTESAMIVDPKHSLETLQRLRDIGVSIAIDDFGTGYSSLAYLKKLPVSELKIDKSFVLNMMQDRDDEKIVRSVIDMGHNFGISVTAEGVEDEATLERLIEMGCDYAQGFYMGRPMPVSDLLHWLEESAWGLVKTCGIGRSQKNPVAIREA